MFIIHNALIGHSTIGNLSPPPPKKKMEKTDPQHQYIKFPLPPPL